MIYKSEFEKLIELLKSSHTKLSTDMGYSKAYLLSTLKEREYLTVKQAAKIYWMCPKHVAQVIPAHRLETIREFLFETGMTTSLDKNSILQKKLSESYVRREAGCCTKVLKFSNNDTD